MQSAQIADLRHAEHSYTTLGVLALPRPALPVVLPTPEGEGCAREAGIARSLLERSLATTAAAPAEIEVMLPALLELATPCGARAAQPDPPERGWPSRGAGFLSWLDARRGAGSPGHLLAGLLGRLDRADLFAVLRDNLKDAEFSRSTLDDTIAAYALEQFSRGARAHWSIDAPHTPRALLTPPIEPFGATALTITMERSLRLETEWEQRAEMRLALQALDAKDQVLTT